MSLFIYWYVPLFVNVYLRVLVCTFMGLRAQVCVYALSVVHSQARLDADGCGDVGGHLLIVRFD